MTVEQPGYVTEIGDYEAGSVRLITVDDSLEAQARWPFDRSTDEWITLNAKVPIAPLRSAARSSQENGTSASSTNRVEFRRTGAGSIALRLVGANAIGPVELEVRLEGEQCQMVMNHLRH